MPDLKDAIRAKVFELASRRNVDAKALSDTDVIPDTGVLDSVAIMSLIVWLEVTFDVSIAEHDLTLDNFGTIEAMAQYLRRVS